MSQVPTQEQQAHAEDKLRAIGAVSEQFTTEIAALQTSVKELEAERAALKERVAKLEEDNADLNNSINVWAAHANEAEERASAAEAKLATREQPEYPAEMAGRPVTSPEVWFNMDMNTAPRGGKLQVLNPGRIAIYAVVTERNKGDFLGWAPMPKIPKDKKR